ncbi:DUF1016 family protein [Candidatus Saccharibacteria bacterium]|nr:DUF1016 family protein [Candidatus Saccharibacteria bacterium]
MRDSYVFDFLTLRKGYKERELGHGMMERIRDNLGLLRVPGGALFFRFFGGGLFG